MLKIIQRLFIQRENIFAIIAGLLITLSLAPFNAWPLGIIAAALLSLSLEKSSPAQAAWRGWLFGTAMFGSGTSWVYVSIHTYGGASVPLAVGLTTIFSMGLALFTTFTCWLYRRSLNDSLFNNTAGFATFWILNEWLRSWFLTGFPWLFLGHAHVDSPLAGFAPVTGVLGISFIVAYSGAVLAQSFSKKLLLIKPLLVVAGLWLAGIALQFISWTQSEGEPINVALVQPATPQQLKWNRHYYHTTLNTLTTMSTPLWANNSVVIWPEAAIPNYLDNAQSFVDEMAELAKNNNTSLITGIPYRTEPDAEHPLGESFNSVIAVGNGSGLYSKQNLVPFGEYVPLQSMLRGVIEFFDLPMSNFARGAANQTPLTITTNNRQITFAPYLCYEIVYGDLVAKSRADILLTLSNDTWFGSSIGPHQHLQIARLRAREIERPLIRATNSGITALTDEHGAITTQIPQFTQQVLTGSVQPRTGLTPYARFESWPILIFGIILLFVSRYTKNR